MRCAGPFVVRWRRAGSLQYGTHSWVHHRTWKNRRPPGTRPVPELEHDERLIASVAKKVRVHELAKELGLTNKEALDLCIALGIDAKSHSSSIEDAQGDRVRRRAERDGLVRAEQPAEPAPAKRTTKKAAAAAKSADVPETGGGVAVAVEEPPAPEAPAVEVVARVAEPAP